MGLLSDDKEYRDALVEVSLLGDLRLALDTDDPRFEKIGAIRQELADAAADMVIARHTKPAAKRKK